MNARQMRKDEQPSIRERIAPSAVFPRIKHLSFLAALKDIGATPEETPFTEPLAGDLLVAYAVEDDVVFRMLTTGEVAELGVTPERLREVAVANCRRRMQMNVSGQPPVLVLETGGDLEACLLLLDEVWPQLNSHVPGEIVVGVPARSALFVTGSESPMGLDVVREGVGELYGQDQVHCLSKHLFVRRNDRWEVFE